MSKKHSFLSTVTFIHSHEIVFARKIPIKKYCVGVIANDITKSNNKTAIGHYNKTKKLCDELNIPFIVLKDYGIDNVVLAIQNNKVTTKYNTILRK